MDGKRRDERLAVCFAGHALSRWRGAIRGGIADRFAEVADVGYLKRRGETSLSDGTLADCYRRGRGTKKDLEKSRRYATRAAERGDERGKKVLQRLD